jgi:hypothetical protein
LAWQQVQQSSFFSFVKKLRLGQEMKLMSAEDVEVKTCRKFTIEIYLTIAH